MSERRHLIITAADATRIAAALSGSTDPELRRISERFRSDTGGDLQEIADELKKLPVCAACSIEGQARSCCSLHAQKTGRRLARLIGRAEGTWPPDQNGRHETPPAPQLPFILRLIVRRVREWLR